MNERHAEYQRYLQSPEWKTLRGVVRQRAMGLCELCQAPMAHVHHVRYPKRFKDDHPDNVLAVCEICHDKIHGIRREETMSTEIMVVSLPFDPKIKFRIIENEKGKWFFLDEVLEKAFFEAASHIRHLLDRPLEQGGPDPEWVWDFKEYQRGGCRTHRMVKKEGFAWFAAKGNKPFARLLYKWLTVDVWNQITDTGKYELSNLTENKPSPAELRRREINALVTLSKEVDRLENKIDSLEKETCEKFIELERKQDELYKISNKVTLISYEGKTTVRARMQQHGLPYDKQIAAKVGLECRRKMNAYGDYSSTKIYDNSIGINVNVVPVEVIDDVLFEFGILRE